MLWRQESTLRFEHPPKGGTRQPREPPSCPDRGPKSLDACNPNRMTVVKDACASMNQLRWAPFLLHHHQKLVQHDARESPSDKGSIPRGVVGHMGAIQGSTRVAPSISGCVCFVGKGIFRDGSRLAPRTVVLCIRQGNTFSAHDHTHDVADVEPETRLTTAVPQRHGPNIHDETHVDDCDDYLMAILR